MSENPREQQLGRRIHKPQFDEATVESFFFTSEERVFGTENCQ